MPVTNHLLLQTAARATSFMEPGQAADVAAFIRACWNPDGGFRGRAEASASDLYYTVFGLSCLSALGVSWEQARLRAYLKAAGDGEGLDGAHLASAVRCWAALAAAGDAEAGVRGRAMLKRLEAFRAGDGGWHHQVPQAVRGSVYGAFLAALAHAESGVELPQRAELLAAIEGLRSGDGGFANVPELPVATTTATAAAVLLRLWLAGAVDRAGVDVLRNREQPRGGFLATAGTPLPDLLSTATALHALAASGAKIQHVEAHVVFIESLWDANGGFHGHPADSMTDCEYTFYALLALGACADG